MKALWQAISIIAIIHMFGLIVVVGFLAGTGRINNERITTVRNLFKLSVEQEKQEQSKREQVAAEAAKQAKAIAATKDALQSPQTIAGRLESTRQRNEITLRQIERTRREVEDLQINLKMAQLLVQKQDEQTKAEKKALEQRLAKIEQQINDKNFKKTVQMYESLPAKQSKKMFQQLIAEQKIDQVVAYLEAMQLRKSAAVLKEFKDPEELIQAVELTERLRARGTQLVTNTK